MSKPPSATADKFLLRLPDGMRDRIAAAAKAANRTSTAEIVYRLQRTFDEDSMPDVTDAEVAAIFLDMHRKAAELADLTKALSDAHTAAPVSATITKFAPRKP